MQDRKLWCQVLWSHSSQTGQDTHEQKRSKSATRTCYEIHEEFQDLTLKTFMLACVSQHSWLGGGELSLSRPVHDKWRPYIQLLYIWERVVCLAIPPLCSLIRSAENDVAIMATINQWVISHCPLHFPFQITFLRPSRSYFFHQEGSHYHYEDLCIISQPLIIYVFPYEKKAKQTNLGLLPLFNCFLTLGSVSIGRIQVIMLKMQDLITCYLNVFIIVLSWTTWKSCSCWNHIRLSCSPAQWLLGGNACFSTLPCYSLWHLLTWVASRSIINEEYERDSFTKQNSSGSLGQLSFIQTQAGFRGYCKSVLPGGN